MLKISFNITQARNAQKEDGIAARLFVLHWELETAGRQYLAYNHVQRGGVEFHWASVSNVAAVVTVNVPPSWQQQQQQVNARVPLGPPTEVLVRPATELKILAPSDIKVEMFHRIHT